MSGVRAWTTELEFAYEHGHVYLLDGAGHWSDDERVDLRMPDSAGFFQPLRIEGWGAKPALELNGYEHVAEFSLDPAVRHAGARLGQLRRDQGRDRARRLPRALERPRRATTGCSCGPGRRRRRGWSSSAAPSDGSDLGDIPALLLDEGVQAVGAVIGTRVRGNALQLYLQLSAWAKRSWRRTIRCDGVVRWQVASEPFGHALLHREHPGLLPFADERGGLSFNGRPAGAGAARAGAARRARTTPRETTSASRTAWPSGSRSATGGWRAGR